LWFQLQSVMECRTTSITFTASRMKTMWLRRGLVLALATLLALFFATKFYYAGVFHGLNPTWTKQLWWQGMEWYGWALFWPVIARICRSLDRPDHRWRQLLGQLLSAALFSLAHCLILTSGARVEAWVFETGMTWWALLKVILINHFHSNVFTYATIVGIWHAIDYYQRLAERERQASELAVRLAQARLQALRMQLHPHFLFNTLNGIAALNYEDPKAANRMLSRLSELLRMTLDEDGAQEVSLRKEVEFCRRYLELEEIRLGERLTVSLEIAPEALDAKVPSLLLQPLVENAIEHGIAPFAAPGRLSISAQKANGRLRLTVRDSGPGLSAIQPSGPPRGIGLSNTRARLVQLYGDNHTFELRNTEEGGLEVHITLPYVEATDTDAKPYEANEDSYAYR
jgi:two-component system LytT family sensor kinase